MSCYPLKDETIGPYRGRVSGALRSPDLLLALLRIPALINAEGAEVLAAGRNRNIKIDLVCKRQTLCVVVKAFGKPSLLSNAIDRRRGSKARRTWMAATALAEAGVGTPTPVAFLERWAEDRLVESYGVTLYQEGISSLAHELDQLLRHEPECAKLMALMQSVADAVWAMHSGAGFLHNDLGNQNLLLRRTGPESWGDVQFIDLNRGRIRASLTARERARDISRLYLPSDLLRVFKEMYYDGVPPQEFQAWERHYRKRYAWHAGTRRYRHPIRELRKQRAPGDPPQYPREKDIWIWDERSGQAQTVLLSRDRMRHYPVSRLWRMLASTVKAVVPVRRAYKGLLAEAYRHPVPMQGRIGVAVEVSAERLDRQLALLSALGPVPVLVRFYHHKAMAARREAAQAVRRLHAAGHSVSIALVQDRAALNQPGAWRAFAEDVLGQVGDVIDAVEIGHAINRVKWGLWDFAEYRALVAGVSSLQAAYPHLTFTGPAVIDFEYPYLLAALDSLPPGFSFGALSHHLYVDRRGPPENRQGEFGSLEKFALLRAIARRRGGHDRVIVSEVNWPLIGTGVYSPVGSPYVSPGPRRNDPSVSEDDYANYMMRYLLIALCSGMVERVYWWRLAAYGYGLVDDSVDGAWRERPAFVLLKVFLRWVGDSVFEERLALNDDGAAAFRFRRPDGTRFSVAYTPGPACDVAFPHPIVRLVDAFDTALPERPDGRVLLSGRPVYVE